MKGTKLAASILVIVFVVFFSCRDEEEIYYDNYYTGNNIAMTGSNEVPAVTTTGSGVINANYSKLSKTLNYSLSFSGLADSATAAHIHGLAGPGFNAVFIQTFSSFPRRKEGTYTGTLFFDGIKLKEEDLLAGKMYINIHSKTYPNGEIRGQLILTQ